LTGSASSSATIAVGGCRDWYLLPKVLRAGRATRGCSGGCSTPHFGQMAGDLLRS
jgi:hypothetical protein